MTLIPFSLRQRDVVLEPLCAVGVGDVALRLGARVQHDSFQQNLADIDVVVAGDSLFVLASPERLPWVDGVSYLGRDAAAPDYLLPTHVEPTLPLGPVLRALRKRVIPDAASPPLAVLFEARRVVSLASAARVDSSRLATWLRRLAEERE